MIFNHISAVNRAQLGKSFLGIGCCAAASLILSGFAPSAQAGVRHQKSSATSDINQRGIDIAKLVRASWSDKINDDFSDAFEKLDKYVGEKITIKISPFDFLLENQSGSGFKYANKTLFLTYNPSESDVLLDNDSKIIKKYIGSNAFGVKRRVTVSSYTSLTIRIKNIDKLNFTAEEEMERKDARLAHILSQVILEVIVAKGDDGKIGSCDGDHDDATVDDPRDVYSLECYFYANAINIKIVDGKRVLLEKQID